MSKTIPGYKITANRTPYRRAGLDLTAPLAIAAGALTKAQLETLRADPIVHIEDMEIDADGETPADGTVIQPAANAKELIEQIKHVDDVASLDALIDGGEERKSVLEAISAQRTKIQGGAE